MKEIDVAIIGAGPGGSAAAISLAQRGFTVALIDKQAFPREKLCGDFVNPINWPVLRKLGVANSILARPHAKVGGFRVTSVTGSGAEAGFSKDGGEACFGLGMRRAVLDQALVECAVSSGVKVRVGARVDRLSRIAQGWQLDTDAGEEWRAGVLIGADGRNSWVAQQLGMNRSAVLRGRAVGFQLRVKCPGAAPGKVEIHLFPSGYAGLVGLGDDEVNLCLSIERKILPRVGLRRFLLQECLPRNPHLKALLARSRGVSRLRSAYPVYRPNRRCFSERVLLVGDAARVSEPVTGEGIYFAMRSGMLAAEALDAAFTRGDLSAGFLRRYARSCNRHFRRRLALNALARFVVYRPKLLDLLIRRSAANGRWLDSLVSAVCAPAPLH